MSDRVGIRVKRLGALTALLAGACLGSVPPQYSELFRLPPPVRADSLRKYPLPEQVEIYLIGINSRHPAESGLAYPLAANGPALIPYILPYLRGEGAPRDNAYLLYVFNVMAYSPNDRRYDLAREEELLAAARAAARTTSDRSAP